MSTFDIRFNNGSKFFVFGPTNCGKTWWWVDFILNVENICSSVPKTICLIYTIWQEKYDEMKNNIDYFIKDSQELESQITNICKGQPTLIIFDDMLNSQNLPFLAKLFTVNGRHLSISMIFLSQRLFMNNENFRKISNNCDYFIVFRNPRNQKDILELAKQITPGSLELLDVYRNATKQPWSYLCINLTQICPPELKYTSNLFDYDGKIKVFVIK